MKGDTGYTDHRPHNLEGYPIIPKGYKYTIEKINCIIHWMGWIDPVNNPQAQIFRKRFESILSMMANDSPIVTELTSSLMWDVVVWLEEFVKRFDGDLQVGYKNGDFVVSSDFSEAEEED